MPDLVARWKAIHDGLAGFGLSPAQRENATSAILSAENPGVTITVEGGGEGTGGGTGNGEMLLYTVEGRVGAMGNVKFSLDALRWELGRGGAQWPEWDSASPESVVAKFEELTVRKLTKVE